MDTYDIYFNEAVGGALDLLEEFYDIKPTIENLENHPSTDRLLIDEFNIPSLINLGERKTTLIRLWVRQEHAHLWNDAVLDAVMRKLKRQAAEQDISLKYEVIIYPT